MPVLIALHLLAAVIWVGGMFFAYMALRPAAASLLEPPLRLPLWSQTFKRFFLWVWIAVALLPITGYVMVFGFFGGMSGLGLHIHVMQGLGWIMIALYLHVYFAPYRRMNQAIAAQDWKEAGRRLGQIRKIVATNLTLGILVVVIASSGRYLAH
jgi:uncharacterized membrane protein